MFSPHSSTTDLIQRKTSCDQNIAKIKKDMDGAVMEKKRWIIKSAVTEVPD